MTCPARDEQFEVFVRLLEKSLSSAKWGKLEDPLKKSAKIFRVLQSLSSSFPSLEASNDCLRQNANSIFANNIGVIGVIFQLCANSFSEFDKVCSKLTQALPELKTVAKLPSYAQVLKMKPDCKSGKHLAAYLRGVTSAMNYIHEILPFFKIALFACNEGIFCTEEYVKASVDFLDVLTMLESTHVASCKQMSGNSFLKVFFNTLDRPFKIVISALKLLFTSPVIENLKFDVILGLCNSAVSIFVSAVDMMNELTLFLLKDYVMLKAVEDALLKKFQLVIEYCKQILELKPSDYSVFKELEHGENYVIMNNTICESVDVSDEKQENSAGNSSVSLNHTHTDATNKLQGASAVETAGPTKDSENVSDANFNPSGSSAELLKTSEVKSSVGVIDVRSVCADTPKDFVSDANLNTSDTSEELQKTLKTLEVKSTVGVIDVSNVCADIPEEFVCNANVKTSGTSAELLKTSEVKSSVGIIDVQSVCAGTPEEFVCNANVKTSGTSAELLKTLEVKSSVGVIDVRSVCADTPEEFVCNANVNTSGSSEEPQKTSEATSIVGVIDVSSVCADIPEESHRTSPLTSAMNVPTVSPNFLDQSYDIIVLYSEETPVTSPVKSSVQVKDTLDSSLAISAETQTILATNSVNVKDTNCNSVSEETLETLVLKPSTHVEVADFSTVANPEETSSDLAVLDTSSLAICTETQTTSAPNSMNVKDTNCESFSEETQESFVLKPSMEVEVADFSTVAYFEGTSRDLAVLNSSLAISTETQTTSAPNSMNVADTDCSGVSKNKQEILALKPSTEEEVADYSTAANFEGSSSNLVVKSKVNTEDTNCKSVSEETPGIFVLIPLMEAIDTNCASVAVSNTIHETFAPETTAIVVDTNQVSFAAVKQTQPTFTSDAKYTNHATVVDSKVVPNKPKTCLPKSVLTIEDTNNSCISERTKTAQKSPVEEKDSSCSSLASSEENPKILARNLSTEVKNTTCSGVATSRKTQKIIVLKTSADKKNTDHSSVAKFTKTQEISERISSTKAKSTNCFSVATAQVTPTTSAVIPKINVDGATVGEDSRVENASCTSGFFLDLEDVKFQSLTLKQRKSLDKVIRSYHQRVKELSFSVKIADSEIQVLCKICGQTLLAENVGKHLNDECQSPNLPTKSNDCQKTPETTPFPYTQSKSTVQYGSAVWFLDITDIEFDSLALEQTSVLKNLIEKINLHTHHFSFGVKVLKSELVTVWCKCCDATFPPETIETHIEDPNHELHIYELCKRSQNTRAALPQISAENWEYLQLAPGEQYMCWCRLCGRRISQSINVWIEHFQSFWHRQELKKLNNLSEPGQSNISRGFFNRGKMRGRHQPTNKWEGKRFGAKVSPCKKTSPSKGKIFSRLFPSGKMQAPGRQETANVWSPRGICPNFSPNSMPSAAQGGILGKFFAPPVSQNEAGKFRAASFNPRVAPYAKPERSIPPGNSQNQRDAVGYWNQFNYHMQNIMRSTLPSTASNPAESAPGPTNESQSQQFFKRS